MASISILPHRQHSGFPLFTTLENHWVCNSLLAASFRNLAQRPWRQRQVKAMTPDGVLFGELLEIHVPAMRDAILGNYLLTVADLWGRQLYHGRQISTPSFTTRVRMEEAISWIES